MTLNRRKCYKIKAFYSFFHYRVARVRRGIYELVNMEAVMCKIIGKINFNKQYYKINSDVKCKHI